MHLHRNTLKRAIDGTRTRDFHLGKVALYQLSHYRIICMPTHTAGIKPVLEGMKLIVSDLSAISSVDVKYKTLQCKL